MSTSAKEFLMFVLAMCAIGPWNNSNYIRRAHNLKCHIFKLLNNFFLDIFCQFSGPFHIGFSFNCRILIGNFLPSSGDSVVNFSGSSSQIWHTLRKLLLFSGMMSPTFLSISSFNLVLSNIDMLNPFMVGWYYHATK